MGAWGWGLWVKREGGEGEVGALKSVEETNRKTGKESKPTDESADACQQYYSQH